MSYTDTHHWQKALLEFEIIYADLGQFWLI